MKQNAILTALLLAAAPVWAQTVVGTSYTNSTPASIADGNPVGTTELLNVSGVGGSVTNVQVQLDITGGFNGDLYAYLVDPAGQMAVLLNRVGVTTGNPSGYSDAGFNITLAATGNDIHYYDIYTPTITGGQLTGTWAADGRNIDPQSAGSVFASTSPTAGLNLYSGLNGGDMNGTWTLFVADMAAGGGSPTLNSFVLTIMTVPEPQTWVMLGGGLAVFCLCRSWRGFKQ
jgi:subtilisin-like proprotein convertase family protein